MSDGSEKVEIYSDRTGEKLCDIKVPQRWHWPIPLPPVVITRHDVWKSPEAVKKWAWTQAQVIDKQKLNLAEQLLQKAKNGKVSFIFKPSDLFCYPCIACGQKTVVSVRTRWFGLKWGKHQGYACTNDKCPMKMVVVPQALIEHIDEMPTEYLSASRAKEDEAKSDREQP
jgi:hypothetical protein